VGVCVCVCVLCVCVWCVCVCECVCVCVCYVCVCVCVWVCVYVCVQQGTTVCDWLRFCVYHVVYRLGPSYRKSCILSHISVYEKIHNCR